MERLVNGLTAGPYNRESYARWSRASLDNDSPRSMHFGKRDCGGGNTNGKVFNAAPFSLVQPVPTETLDVRPYTTQRNFPDSPSNMSKGGFMASSVRRQPFGASLSASQGFGSTAATIDARRSRAFGQHRDRTASRGSLSPHRSPRPHSTRLRAQAARPFSVSANGLGRDETMPAALTSSQRGEGWDTLEEFQSLPAIPSSLDFAQPEHPWPPQDAWMPMRRTGGASLRHVPPPKSPFYNDLSFLSPVDRGRQPGKCLYYNPGGWR